MATMVHVNICYHAIWNRAVESIYSLQIREDKALATVKREEKENM